MKPITFYLPKSRSKRIQRNNEQLKCLLHELNDVLVSRIDFTAADNEKRVALQNGNELQHEVLVVYRPELDNVVVRLHFKARYTLTFKAYQKEYVADFALDSIFGGHSPRVNNITQLIAGILLEEKNHKIRQMKTLCLLSFFTAILTLLSCSLFGRLEILQILRLPLLLGFYVFLGISICLWLWSALSKYNNRYGGVSFAGDGVMEEVLPKI